MTATLNDQQKAFEALRACVDVMLHDGVPTDKDHPARVALDKAEAVLASDAPAGAVPRPSDDDLWDQTLQERDGYHEWADKLAAAIAEHFGIDIGEHSSANNPWSVALDTLESMPATAAHAGATQISEQHIIAAIKKACGEYRTNDSYSFEDVWNCIEAAFATAPTPAATAPAALMDHRIKRMAADFWKVQNVMGVDSCMFDAVGFAHALLATNPDSTGVSK